MITMTQALTAQRFVKLAPDGSDLLVGKIGNEVRCRRNGQTKTWKREPSRFQIPVKRGLYEYGYIDNNNAHEWRVE